MKLCIGSVADQEVEREHIVQDAGSDDGTLSWLTTDSRVKAFVEKDRGMYDAVNRGCRRAAGDPLACLDCDEQYLPGALTKVAAFFDRRPEVGVLFGHCIVVDGMGSNICERRSPTPQLLHTWTASNPAFLTAVTFIRRRMLDTLKLWFNPDYRDAGDQDWALRLVQARVKTAVLPEFLSVFTETGAYVNLGANALRESEEFHATAPLWVRALAPGALAHFRWRRWCAGHYRCTPHDYAIYTEESPTRRKTFRVAHPTFRWVRPASA